MTTGCAKGTTCIQLTGNLTLQNSATLVQKATAPAQENSLEISAYGLALDSTSSISAVGKGFVSAGTANKFRSMNNQDVDGIGILYYAAGSHGGRGGVEAYWNATNATYGSVTNPYESGASGLFYGNAIANVGAGGGIVRIDLHGGSATIDGTIDASAASTSGGCWNVQGAGGSVYVTSATPRAPAPSAPTAAAAPASPAAVVASPSTTSRAAAASPIHPRSAAASRLSAAIARAAPIPAAAPARST